MDVWEEELDYAWQMRLEREQDRKIMMNNPSDELEDIDLQDTIDSLNHQIDENCQLKEEIDELKIQANADYEKLVEKTNNDALNYQSIIGDLEARIDIKEEENKKLKHDIEEFCEIDFLKTKKNETLKADNKFLKADVKSLREDITGLREVIRELIDEKEELEYNNSLNGKEIEKLKEELDVLSLA
jgi:chromosome segregation ATPase